MTKLYKSNEVTFSTDVFVAIAIVIANKLPIMFKDSATFVSHGSLVPLPPTPRPTSPRPTPEPLPTKKVALVLAI